MSARAGRTASKRSYTQNSGSESEGAAEEDAFSPVKKARTQRRPRVVRRDSEDEDSANSVDGNDENEDDDVLDGKKIPFEAGQIMTVSVQNFMCHRKFTMNFGRHLNFITGRNGSGKSAIVAAIQLCLGSSARHTGRGSNIGKYIREGSEDPAILEITLLNSGPDAFKPNEYGDRIIVKRVIAKTTSSYHMLSKTRVEISKNKSELESMLSAFNIYVDTPCCVLTQEESKRLIHGTAKEKYQFFIKATGLRLVHDRLIATEAALDAAEEDRKRMLPEIGKLRQHRDDCKDRLAEFQALDKFQLQIAVENAKLLWDEVRTAEGVVEGLQEDAAEKQAALDDAIKDLEAETGDDSDRQREFDAVQEALKAIQAEEGPISERIAAAQAEVVKVQRQIGKRKTELLQYQGNKAEYEQRGKAVTQELKVLRDKAMQDADQEERLVMDQIKQCETAIAKLSEQNAGLERQRRDASATNAQLQHELKGNSTALNAKQSSLQGIEEAIRNAVTGGSNAAKFGPRVPDILNRISRTRFQGPVIGPVGMGITLRAGCEEWAFALEKSLFTVLRAFVVTSVADRNALYGILREVGAADQHSIILQHSPARYTPDILPLPEGFITMMDAINVTEDLAFNCLLDQNNIDRVGLVEDEAVMLQHLVEHANGDDRLRYRLMRVTTKKAVSVSYRGGNQASELPNKSPFQRLLAGDTSTYAANLREDAESTAQEMEELKVLMRELNQRVTAGNNEIKRLTDTISKNANDIRTEQRRKQGLDNKLQEVQETGRIDTTAMETEVDELKEAIRAVGFEIEQVQSTINVLNAELKVHQAEKTAADRDMTDLTQRNDKQLSLLSKLASKRDNATKRRAGLQKNVDNKKHALDLSLAEVQKETAIRDDKLILAEERTRETVPDWDGNPIPLNAREIKKTITAKIAKLKAEHEEGLRKMNLAGYTCAILMERYTAAKEAYKAMRVKFAAAERATEDVRAAKDDAKLKWQRAFQATVAKTKKSFDRYANRQGASGTVEFDTAKEEMRLIVQMDMNDKNTQATDVKNLSGGERSYVTLCLLLALGHVTESPFRLLDEYDVFMDEARRNDTLQSIRQHALSPEQRNRQMIVITPNTLASVKTNNTKEVRIFKMADPEKRSAHGLQQMTLD